MSIKTTFSKETKQRCLSGELSLFAIATFGEDMEIIQEEERRFLKGKSFSIDCYFSFWKPLWLFEALPPPLFAQPQDIYWDDSTNMAAKLYLFRSQNHYDNDWTRQIRLIYGNYFPYDLNIIRPADVSDVENSLQEEAFPIIQAQQSHLQELPVQQATWECSWPNFVSGLGEVDHKTYSLKPGILSDIQTKASGFLRLQTYVNNTNKTAPRTGLHPFHIFMIFPIEQEPWKSYFRTLRERSTSAGPFQYSRYISFIGSVVGTLSLVCVNEELSDSEPILIVVPHTHNPITLDKLGSTPSLPSTPKASTSKKVSRFKAPVPVFGTDKQDLSSPSKPAQERGSPFNLTAKLSNITSTASDNPVENDTILSEALISEETRDKTPVSAHLIDDSGDELVDIDKYSDTTAKEPVEETVESARAGKKRKYATPDPVEVEETGYFTRNTSKRPKLFK